MEVANSPRFSKGTLEFIDKASRQKREDWLVRNRPDFEKYVLDPLNHFTRQLKAKVGPVANGYHFPQRGLGRLKRSALGASEDGQLFRDYVSYSVSRPSESRFDKNPNLFFLIQPGDPDGDEVLVAGGFYMPSSRHLRAVREAIAVDATPFDRLFASQAFAARFPGGFSDERKSTRLPRGFDPTHPRMEWLKLQAFFVWRSYKKREFASADFADLVARDWMQILRLNELLEQAIQGRWSRVAKPKSQKLEGGLSSRLEEIEAPQRKMDF